MSELPPWCTRADAIQSYVARPFVADTPERLAVHTALANSIEIATNSFLERWQKCEPTYSTHEYSTSLGWISLANTMVNVYRKAHWGLVESSPIYVKNLGTALDAYERYIGGTLPKATGRRWRTQVQELLTRAMAEGIPTSVALFAVAPRVVEAHFPELSLPDKVALAKSLLPWLKKAGILQARLSRNGNDTHLDKVSVPSEPVCGKRNYKVLSYDPGAFEITYDADGRPKLAETGQSYDSSDLERPFRGCPAVARGSITKINNLIAQIVIDKRAYEQVLGLTP